MLPMYTSPSKIPQIIGGKRGRPTPTVKLELPRISRIQPVFHVSFLNEYKPRPGVIPSTPELFLDQDGFPIFPVDRIVGEQFMTTKGRSQRVFSFVGRGTQS